MIPENVKKVFEENPWFIATCGDEPNVVPVGFKRINEDGMFTVGAVLLETTLNNIRANGKVAIAACGAGAESYQVKGTAFLVTEGPDFDFFAKLAQDTFKGAHPAKCAIIVTPTRMIINSPNADNNKVISW